MEQANTRKLLTAVAVALGLILVVGITWPLLHQTPKLKLGYALQVPANFSTATPIGGDLLAVKPSGLARYNVATGAKQLLSENSVTIGLLGLDSLSSPGDGRYVLFHTNTVLPSSGLANVLSARGYDVSLDYWWIYDAVDKVFVPLPANTLQVKYVNGSYVGLSSNYPGEILTTYKPDGSVVKSLRISNASDFVPLADGYLLQATDGKLLYTRDGVVSKWVARSSTIVGITSNSQVLVALISEGKTRNLVQISTQDWSTKVIAKNVSGSQAWLNSGQVLYSLATVGNDHTDMRSYNVVTGKTLAWKTTQKDVQLTPLQLLSNNTALVSSSNNKLFVVSDHALASKIAD